MCQTGLATITTFGLTFLVVVTIGAVVASVYVLLRRKSLVGRGFFVSRGVVLYALSFLVILVILGLTALTALIASLA